MDREQIRNKINELYTVIENSCSKIDELRQVCSHPSYQLGIYKVDELNDTMIQRLCDICDMPLGVPTQEEIDEFMNTFNGQEVVLNRS